MKQIKEFIVKKVTSVQPNKIDLIVEVDSVLKQFNIKFEAIDGEFLFDFPKELEFLIRANEVVLSKRLVVFLNKSIETQTNTPVVLYSQEVRKTTISKSNHLKAA
jgi:hypothetical protein